jgi:hypothetical protein
MTKETGGPAFPFIDSASPLEHSGMTLRDYFAAKAILYTIDQNTTYVEAADSAYRMADAMIKAREQ